jgi:hypothetical protein
MSDFHNAFKAFLATPGSASPKERAESPQTPPAAPPARRGRGGGVVVKAPSPEVEIPAAAIRQEGAASKTAVSCSVPDPELFGLDGQGSIVP